MLYLVQKKTKSARLNPLCLPVCVESLTGVRLCKCLKKLYQLYQLVENTQSLKILFSYLTL